MAHLFSPGGVTAVDGSNEFQCDKCFKICKNERGLNVHRTVHCSTVIGEKKAREPTSIEELFADAPIPVKKRLTEKAHLLNQLALTCAQSSTDVSTNAKVAILRGNEMLTPTSAAKTIDDLVEISSILKELKKPKLENLKEILDGADYDEQTELRLIKSLTVEDLALLKIKLTNRLTLINFLLLNNGLAPIETGCKFVISHRSDFESALVRDASVDTPTVDSIFENIA